jgi:hypothetical protein
MESRMRCKPHVRFGGAAAGNSHGENRDTTPAADAYWTRTGRTDINDLTLACGPDNRLVEKGWTTRTNAQGDTEWIPPAHLDHGQPRTNPHHHPERFLHDGDDEPV